MKGSTARQRHRFWSFCSTTCCCWRKCTTHINCNRKFAGCTMKLGFDFLQKMGYFPCHHSPPWRCNQKTASKRCQLSTELHYTINHINTDITVPRVCRHRHSSSKERTTFQTSAVKFKFTAVDTNYSERQLNDSLFPIRLGPFFIENEDILAYESVWFVLRRTKISNVLVVCPLR